MVWTYPVLAFEGQVYAFQEVTPGTGPTTEGMGEVWLLQPFDLDIDASNIKVYGGGSRDAAAIKRGSLKPNLQLVCTPKIVDLGYWAPYMIANPTSTFSIEALFARAVSGYQSFRYYGCTLSKLQLKMAGLEDMLQVKMDFEALTAAVGTSKWSSGTYTNDWGSLVGWDGIYFKYAGAVDEKLVGFEVNVDEHLRRVPVIRNSNGYLSKYIVHGKRETSGFVNMLFLDQARISDVLNDVDFSLEFGFGSGTDSQKCVLTNCKWDRVQVPVKDEEEVVLKLPFTAKTISIVDQ